MTLASLALYSKGTSRRLWTVIVAIAAIWLMATLLESTATFLVHPLFLNAIVLLIDYSAKMEGESNRTPRTGPSAFEPLDSCSADHLLTELRSP